MTFKIYDKRDYFDFDIVNFPFFDGNVPSFIPVAESLIRCFFLRWYFGGVVWHPRDLHVLAGHCASCFVRFVI